MTNPKQYRYTKSHEWVGELNGDVLKVGITAHAQSMLGDIVYVELPHVGQVVEQGKEMMVLESVKAAADVYAPLNGEVVAVNESLPDQPELVNQSPFDQGWLFQLKVSDVNDLESLMSDKAYSEMI